jgi:hypothetical protein
MTIDSTVFPHKTNHKPTWRSPDFSVENQIDHVLIYTRHHSDLMDVRIFKGANVDSDHYLVGAKIRACISNLQKLKATKRKRYRTSQRGNDEEMRKLYISRIEEYLSQHPYGQGTTVDDDGKSAKI